MTLAFVGGGAGRFCVVLAGLGASMMVYGFSMRRSKRPPPASAYSRAYFDMAPVEARIGAALLIIGVIGLVIAVLA
jgi:hypothetical protein